MKCTIQSQTDLKNDTTTTCENLPKRKASFLLRRLFSLYSPDGKVTYTG